MAETVGQQIARTFGYGDRPGDLAKVIDDALTTHGEAIRAEMRAKHDALLYQYRACHDEKEATIAARDATIAGLRAAICRVLQSADEDRGRISISRGVYEGLRRALTPTPPVAPEDPHAR